MGWAHQSMILGPPDYEYVLIENFYNDRKFIVSNADNIESKVDDIEYFIKDASWEVKVLRGVKKKNIH